MSKVQSNQDTNQFDQYTKSDWAKFLNEGAFRGCKINKLATRLHANPLHKLIKDQNEIKLTYNGSKAVTIKLTKLIKKHDDWSISRLFHNIKMFCSSKYAKGFKDQIDLLAHELSQINQRSGYPKLLNDFVDDQVIDTHSLDDIKAFFYNNQRLIDGATGDDVVQADLFKLSGIVREKFNDANLAHLISSKATAVVPLPVGVGLNVLPNEIQSLIFSNLGSDIALNQLLVSKQISKNVSPVKDALINDNNTCLRSLGCKTAKEAVQYVIDHKLTSANLTTFKDFKDEDLDNLSQCTTLKQISLNSFNFSGDKLVAVLKTFDRLEDIDLLACLQVSTGQLLEIIQDHNELQGLSLHRMHTDNEIAKAIVNLSNLQRLSLSAGYLTTEDQLVELLEKNSNLQSLTLDNLDSSKRIVDAICNLNDLKDIALDGLADYEIVKILENQKNLKSLRLYDINSRIVNAVLDIANLDHLELCNYHRDNCIANILEKHSNLQSLVLSPFQQVGDETIEALGSLHHLQTLKMPIHQILKMNVHPNLKSLDLSDTKATLDEYCEAIGKFPNLRQLDLSNCEIATGNDSQFWPFSKKEAKKILRNNPGLKINFQR